MPSFYNQSCNLDARATPYTNVKYQGNTRSGGKKTEKILDIANGKKLSIMETPGYVVTAPHSIINDNTAIDYRTMYNGFNMLRNPGDSEEYTLYSDYERCMNSNAELQEYLKDSESPTVKNILKYYNGEDNQFDPHGLARYKPQDFIYNKFYGQIPNNYMITLRRYTMPCSDHMFGFDLSPDMINKIGGYPESYYALATAVTYMGEQTGNQLSDILKFSYGQKYEEKQSSVESLQNPDGGLAAQLRKNNMTDDFLSAQGGKGNYGLFASAVMAKGKTVDQAFANVNAYPGDAFLTRYPDAVLGPLNRIDSVTARSAGLTYTNDFSLVFEYDLKSLQMINPKIAMLDIICNFMMLTGNYGSFWGGMTRFYGTQNNIAPAFGNPVLLRQAKFGEYLTTVWNDVETGFNTLRKTPDGGQKGIVDTLLDVIKGGAEAMLGNLIGGKLGPMSSALMPRSLLSGNPTGAWHVVIGNPLNPILTMGNMCIENTDVEFGNTLGHDDFPTSVKFTVHLKHGRPRDLADIQSMFNAGKGRMYLFTEDIADAMHADEQFKNDFYAGFGNRNKEGNANNADVAEYGPNSAYEKVKEQVVAGTKYIKNKSEKTIMSAVNNLTS